ncbi:BREX system P-loop protein BrxC [Slackia heliotrinireducens]|uniref:BREX system P-loop protein BrxC n=1 Tax=Slackia heliotrinireducens TaxID=84110 RepID=UPI003315B709
MLIRDIFENDIDRNINGVVKVGDTDEALLEQELREYVVTRELAGHFADFYGSYERAIDRPTGKIGVWISGFFGSGKSHFLKILSYLLANREVGGKRAIDYFEGKIADPMVFAKMQRAASVPTEAILFNIDSKGGQWKEGSSAKTALLRSFERVFFENQGFYGEDLKLARLEAHIASQGKTDAFRAAFEEKSGLDWADNRESYAFYEDDVVASLVEVLGMSESAAQHWFDGTEDDVISSERFAQMVNEYVEGKAAAGGDFRLLFMADEVGQFIGSDPDLMLSLQTLAEDLGTACAGKVWIVVTSQEAIDKVTNLVNTEFSKIQGRFDTRLSLSSSSVDEVIKKRILQKTDVAQAALESDYASQGTVLKNLFTFDDSTSDLFGYAGASDYVESYPFVGYQFKILPAVFHAIREHGFSGKHMSTGERSMLSAFQESAQKVEERGTGALVPFWRFYDTVEKSLDHGIRQVVNRCQEAAEAGHGLEPQDVRVLKTLYLIRYINDVKPSVNNIANLMIEDVNVDKMALRASVQASLERLVRENKAARNGDRYNFLTSEEQDVADEISKVQVDPAVVLGRIKKLLFDGIYTKTKHRKGANDFPFDRYADDSVHGKDAGGMKLNVITYAHEWSRLSAGEFALKSVGQALVGLAEGDYYELLEMAEKVAKYVQTSPVTQWPKSRQDIVRDKQREARANEARAKESLSKAIMDGRFAVDGRSVSPKAPNVEKALDAVLDELVSSVYTKAGLIDSPVENDSDIIQILRGTKHGEPLPGEEGANHAAVEEVERFLDAQAWGNQSTSMGDIQRKYQKAPYGWREVDVAAVVAQLVNRQRVSVSFGGKQLGRDDVHEMVKRLRRETEGAQVKKREALESAVLARAQKTMKELTGSSSVPADEDGLFSFAKSELEALRDECQELLAGQYAKRREYPGKEAVSESKKLADELLANAVDPVAFIKGIASRDASERLADAAEDMDRVRGFFASQARLFDESLDLIEALKTEGVYIEGDESAQKAIRRIKEIISMGEPYGAIKELGHLNNTVQNSLHAVVKTKRDNLLDSIKDANEQIIRYASEEGVGFESAVSPVVRLAEEGALAKRSKANSTDACSQLDAQLSQLNAWREQQMRKVDEAVANARAEAERRKREEQTGRVENGQQPATVPPKKQTKVLARSRVCPTKTLRTTEEVDSYVESIRTKLLKALEKNDAVRLGD